MSLPPLQYRYHQVLRVAALVVALVLVFDSGLLDESTRVLSQQAQQQMASTIGVNVGVAPTELNTITAELSQWQRSLEARELALSERELTTGVVRDGTGEPVAFSTYLLSGLLFVLIVLITLNYILDYRRARYQVVPT